MPFFVTEMVWVASVPVQIVNGPSNEITTVSEYFSVSEPPLAANATSPLAVVEIPYASP